MTTIKPFDISTAKVAVLMGGRSAEREISFMSGEGVLKALQSKGVNAHAFDPANQAMDQLTQQGFTHAFIALHGRYGEDGSVQGALELLGIPYTGSGVMASAIAMDKVMTKRIWTALGLSTPKSVSLAPDEQSQQAIAAIPQTLGLPLIVKPPREGSSIGITKVIKTDEIQAATDLAIQYDPDLLCEEFIDGEELT
ncbi:MAG: D-alanine--D-alanine ligase, partial [Betaproteobacteria bacterium]